MHIKPGQLPILLVNVLILLIFSTIYIIRGDFEFLLFIGVIVLFLFIILYTNKRVNYPNSILWGLTAWLLLHMCGGSVKINGIRLYETILIPISSTLGIFRYDQFVHIIGFGVATCVMYAVLKPSLGKTRWVATSIIVVMAGLGVGALNEIIEFIITLLVPESGVGDYVNNSLDLVADLIGSLLAMIYILLTERH